MNTTQFYILATVLGIALTSGVYSSPYYSSNATQRMENYNIMNSTNWNDQRVNTNSESNSRSVSRNNNQSDASNSNTNSNGGSPVNIGGNTYKERLQIPNAPDLNSTIIGQTGTESISGGVSTVFGGITFGKSKTVREMRAVYSANAKKIKSDILKQDIENLTKLERLDPTSALILKRHILRKYK